VPSDHDLIVTLLEKVRQLEDREKTRGMREWGVIVGLIVALGNAAIERFAPSAVEPVAAAVMAVAGFIGGWI